MTKDYAKRSVRSSKKRTVKKAVRSNSKRKKTYPFPWRRVLALLMVLGIIVFLLAFLKLNFSHFHLKHQQSSGTVTKVLSGAMPKKTTLSKPVYTFKPLDIDQKILVYRLQFGTLPKGEHLDHLKASLKQNHITFSLKPVDKTQPIMYRVLSQTYNDLSAIQKQQQDLSQQGLWSVIVRQ